MSDNARFKIAELEEQVQKLKTKEEKHYSSLVNSIVTLSDKIEAAETTLRDNSKAIGMLAFKLEELKGKKVA